MANVSIGQIGNPYFDNLNDRTKAFLNLVWHRSVAEIEQTISMTASETQGTRLSVRLPVKNLDEASIRSVAIPFQGSCIVCEAIVPINGTGGFIAYYGWNSSNRRTPLEHKQAEQDLVRRITMRTRRSMIARDLSSYQADLAIPGDRDWSGQEVEQLTRIYQESFSDYLVDFNVESVKDMLSSNLTALVRHQNEIVSVAMAEVAHIEIGGEGLDISEISEVATHPNYHRRGLAHLAVDILIKQLRQRNINLIFMEARAVSFGMMAVAWDLGMFPMGTLEKHCVISSPFSDLPQNGSYGDLVVLSLPTC